MKTTFFLMMALVGASAPAIGADASTDRVRIQIQGDVGVAPQETVETAVAVFGSVLVDGTVEKNAVSVFGDVTISSSGAVGGDAISVGGRVVREVGGRLSGKEVQVRAPGRDFGRVLLVTLPVIAAAVAFVGALILLASTVGFVVLIVAILILFERNVAAARSVMVDDPLRTGLIGLLVFLGAIPIVVFLSVTVVGIPLALLVGAALMAGICLGTVAVCDWVGSEIARALKKPLAPVWSGLLGLTVLFLVGLVPWLGNVIHIVAILLGLGAVARTKFKPAPRAPSLV